MPDDAPSLAEALAQAADGDEIRITEAGRHAVPADAIEVAVTIRGRNDPSEVVLEGPLTAHAPLVLADLTVAAADARAAIDGTDLRLESAWIVGEASQSTVIRLTGALTGTGVRLTDLTAATDVVSGATSVDLAGLVVRGVTAARLFSADDVTLRETDVRCSTLDEIAVATARVTLDGALLSGTGFGTAFRGPSAGSVRNVTVIGKNETGTAIALSAGDGLVLADVVIVGVQVGVRGDAAEVQASGLVMSRVASPGDGDGGFAAAIVSSTTIVDPLLEPAGCEDGAWPRYGSPLVDAGAADRADRDGSPTDIGATGGPDGLALAPDADDDRVDASRDCDESDPLVAPGREDVLGDGIDRDCDGIDGVDADGDGAAAGDGDCADDDPARFEGNSDPFGDAVDQDCDGADGVDQDGDGARSAASGGDDCDDADAAVHPGAAEDDGAADLDCDGWGSPFVDTTLPTACDCDHAAAPSPAWALLLLLLRRRG